MTQEEKTRLTEYFTSWPNKKTAHDRLEFNKLLTEFEQQHKEDWDRFAPGIHTSAQKFRDREEDSISCSDGYLFINERLKEMTGVSFKDVNKIIDSIEKLEWAMGSYSSWPLWLQGFVHLHIIGEIKLKRGRKPPNWAKGWDVYKIFTTLTDGSLIDKSKSQPERLKLSKNEAYQFIAELCEVPGWDNYQHEINNNLSSGANTVKSYIGRL